ncbi:MAG: hypothetical protein ACP5O2_10180 [Bacteroidales bacterium]
MKNLTLIFLAVVTIFLASCQKETIAPQPTENPQSVKDMVVSPSFDWKTTNMVKLQLVGYANSTCTISYPDGTLIQKVFLKKNEPLSLQLSLPTASKKLQLSYMGQIVDLDLSGSEISYTFN